MIPGTAGIASFESLVFVGVILPFVVKFALGNLDPELCNVFGKAVHTPIPSFASALGNTINHAVVAETGLPGIMRGVAVIITAIYSKRLKRLHVAVGQRAAIK